MLEQKLNELEQSDIYPFHMPGHKRAFLPFANPYAIDITEIEGFDNLHHATGILQEAQQKAADLYGPYSPVRRRPTLHPASCSWRRWPL